MHDERLRDALRACYEGRCTQRDVIERSGLAQHRITKLMTGQEEATPREIALIEQACDRPRGWVLIQAGYVADVTTTLEALAVEPGFDDEMRSTVIRMMTGVLENCRPEPWGTGRGVV